MGANLNQADPMQISKSFLPRRGQQDTMATEKRGIILLEGEFFVEYPNTGPGKPGTYRIKIGDGKSRYMDLPYAFGDTANEILQITEDHSTTISFDEAMKLIKNGASVGTVVLNLKYALKDLNKQFHEHDDDEVRHITGDERDKWNVVGESDCLTSEDLNNCTVIGKRYYAEVNNACTHRPDGVQGFGMEVYLASPTVTVQELTQSNVNPGRKWVRLKTPTGWTEWAAILSGNYVWEDAPYGIYATYDYLKQQIDTTYIKTITHTMTPSVRNLSKGDVEQVLTHLWTYDVGNGHREQISEYNEANTQYQFHVKKSAADGDVIIQLTSTDRTNNEVKIIGDKKGVKVDALGDEITVHSDYQISTATNTEDPGGVKIQLDDINENRQYIIIHGKDDADVYRDPTTGDIVVEVDTDIDASKIVSGIISMDRLPVGVMERMVDVPDDTARFALTTATVQNGDTVRVLDTKIMYMVVDQNNLNNANGYKEYVSYSAVKMRDKRTFDGVNYDGTENIIHYGVCNTAARTAAKEVPCSNFVLATGARIAVRMTNTNTVANPTLNVNGTGAKAILWRGVAPQANLLQANYLYEFIYTGTNWEMVGDDGMAFQLRDPRTIDGVIFNATKNITHYGECTTAAGTADKVVTCDGFVLATGARIVVRIANTNTAANPTLNVNNTGAKAIHWRNVAPQANLLQANYLYEFVYTGTYYELVGDDGMAFQLRDPRTIDGVSFNGTANIIHYGTCATAAATAAKVVSCPGFMLQTGARISVKFNNANTAANPTLNVNNTGAKSIKHPFAGGNTVTTAFLKAGVVYDMVYDGANYIITGSSHISYFDGGDEG